MTTPTRRRPAAIAHDHDHHAGQDAPSDGGRSPLRLLLAWFIAPTVLLVLSLALHWKF